MSRELRQAAGLGQALKGSQGVFRSTPTSGLTWWRSILLGSANSRRRVRNDRVERAIRSTAVAAHWRSTLAQTGCDVPVSDCIFGWALIIFP
jgi:hypothetical protein